MRSPEESNSQDKKQMVGAGVGWGGWSCCLMGTELQFGKMKILEMDVRDGYTTM